MSCPFRINSGQKRVSPANVVHAGPRGGSPGNGALDRARGPRWPLAGWLPRGFAGRRPAAPLSFPGLQSVFRVPSRPKDTSCGRKRKRGIAEKGQRGREHQLDLIKTYDASRKRYVDLRHETTERAQAIPKIRGDRSRNRKTRKVARVLPNSATPTRRLLVFGGVTREAPCSAVNPVGRRKADNCEMEGKTAE